MKTNETQVVEVPQDDFLEFEAMRGGVERIRGALHKYEGEQLYYSRLVSLLYKLYTREDLRW